MAISIVESFDEYKLLPEVKLDDTLDFYGVDPLLLSCIQYRIYDGGYQITMSFYSEEQVTSLLKKATLEDYTLAADIKRYYSSKYMLRELKDNSLTTYKANVLKLFGVENYRKVPAKYAGIAYKLPFFYHHDTKLDAMFEEHASDGKYQKLSYLKEETKKLQFIQVLEPSSKKFPDRHYWFKDDSGRMYMFAGKTPNPLLSLLDQMLEKNKSITISESQVVSKSFYNHQYYQLTTPKFIYE